MPGRTIAHYQILDKLGEGGMGVVYRALDGRLGRTVALKLLPPDKTADPERKRRFIQEARSASSLNHPNIVTIYDIGSQDGTDYIAMELVEGRTLDALIPRQGMPVGKVLRIGEQIASAVAAAHGAGIVHRDLKPGNIMVTDSGLVKVLDFGLAKLIEKTTLSPDATTAMTGEGRIVGTVGYLSPEQAQGLKLDGRSDIFSLGAVLYEMIAGQKAFGGETKVSTLAEILNAEPKALSASIPPELDRVVTRCLRKDPARRFQTMADLKVALEELKEETESGQLAAAAVAGSPPTRRIWLAFIAMAFVAAIAAGGGLWLWGRKGDSTAGPTNLRQITHDDGISEYPALSPDGKLVAYDSDRAGSGRYDVWVQQTAGSSPIRLTKEPGSHRCPAFSADGARVFFNSSGPPQGIYAVPALGGEPTLFAADGGCPVVSPDGRSIAYIGRQSGHLFIVAASGGEPKAIARDLSSGRNGPDRPVWSPDSQQLVFYGIKSGQPQTTAWWATSTSGTPWPTKWLPWARENGFIGGEADVWLPGNTLISSLLKDGNAQIYRTKATVSPTAPEITTKQLAEAEARPLTMGGVWNSQTALAAGKMAFMSGLPTAAIWSIPGDTDQGKVTGQPEKLTSGQARYGSVSSTPDGRVLAFSSNRSGGADGIFIRHMETGEEHGFVAQGSEIYSGYPLLTADGAEMIYSGHSNSLLIADVYLAPVSGGSARKLCDLCGPTSSLSADGKGFLSALGDNAQPAVKLVDTATGQASTILQQPNYPLGRPRFSPDGKWVVFLIVHNGSSAEVAVAPFRGAASIPEEEWIPITPATANVEQAFWSPNGRLIYFVTNLGGNYSLFARRLDEKHRPVDAPFRVLQFSGRVHPFGNSTARGSADALTAVPGRFIGAMPEYTYNIWMMDVPR